MSSQNATNFLRGGKFDDKIYFKKMLLINDTAIFFSFFVLCTCCEQNQACQRFFSVELGGRQHIF